MDILDWIPTFVGTTKRPLTYVTSTEGEADKPKIQRSLDKLEMTKDVATDP